MLRIASLTTAALLVAGAASASPVEERIRFGDLDLSSRAGAVEFDARISRAADRFCRGVSALERPVCRNGIRQEALSLLPSTARTDYARGRFGFDA
jgi:UrcA family protein